MSFVTCKFDIKDPYKKLELICDQCKKPIMGDTVFTMITIKEGLNDQMHFCNYMHVAKYYEDKYVNG